MAYGSLSPRQHSSKHLTHIPHEPWDAGCGLSVDTVGPAAKPGQALCTRLALGRHLETCIWRRFPPFLELREWLYLCKQCGLCRTPTFLLGVWDVPSWRCLCHQSPGRALHTESLMSCGRHWHAHHRLLLGELSPSPFETE